MKIPCTLVLLLSLTRCISTRLLALPEQGEMVAQSQGLAPSTGIAPRRGGAKSERAQERAADGVYCTSIYSERLDDTLE